MSAPVQQPQPGLKEIIEAISHDHMTALQALGLVRLLSASTYSVDHILDNSPFFTALHNCAHQTLVMAISRMFDSNPKTAGILGACNHAKMHPQECTWLFSAEGKAQVPDGLQEVAATSDKWIAWRNALPFTEQIIILRNQYVGHRGLKPTLGKAKPVKIDWPDILSALQGTDSLVNDFKKLIGDPYILHQHIYDEIIRDGSVIVAFAEAHCELLIEDPSKSERMNSITEMIRQAEKDQKASNGWSLYASINDQLS